MTGLWDGGHTCFIPPCTHLDFGVWESWFPLRLCLLYMRGSVPVCGENVLPVWLNPVYLSLCSSWPLPCVCPPAPNQPLRAELEVLLPPVGLGQLRHSIRGWTAAHKENLLGSFWFSVTEGEFFVLYFLKRHYVVLEKKLKQWKKQNHDCDHAPTPTLCQLFAE